MASQWTKTLAGALTVVMNLAGDHSLSRSAFLCIGTVHCIVRPSGSNGRDPSSARFRFVAFRRQSALRRRSSGGVGSKNQHVSTGGTCALLQARKEVRSAEERQ